MSQNNYDSHCSLCKLIAKALTILIKTLLILSFIGVSIEILLRLGGYSPVPLAKRGLSATVPDYWTKWAMRPSVRNGPEYVWTNAYGLHEDRELKLTKQKNIVRVAVVGTSVVWGPGHNFPNTIPRAAEIKLKEAGCNAEVLNFGNMGFNAVNISSLLQVRVHQFNPDVVVFVADLQALAPQWPTPNPMLKMPDQDLIVKLPWHKAVFMRTTEYSTLMSILSDTKLLLKYIEKYIPLPIEQPKLPEKKKVLSKDRDKKYIKLASKALVSLYSTKQKSSLNQAKKEEIKNYEEFKAKELGGIIAAISSFYNKLKIPFYLVTPYGPYFNFSDEELKTFSLNMLVEEARLYGSMRKALPRVVELNTNILSEVGTEYGASVINMIKASRSSQGLKNKDFSSDAIHFTAQGNRNVGAIIAERLKQDGICNQG